MDPGDSMRLVFDVSVANAAVFNKNAKRVTNQLASKKFKVRAWHDDRHKDMYLQNQATTSKVAFEYCLVARTKQRYVAKTVESRLDGKLHHPEALRSFEDRGSQIFTTRLVPLFFM